MKLKRKKTNKKIWAGIVFSFLLVVLLFLGAVKSKDWGGDIWSFGLGHTFWLNPIIGHADGQEEVSKIKEFAFKENLKLTSIARNNRFLEVTFLNNLTCTFSLGKDLDYQLASLQFILWRSKIRGEYPSKVDLRFDKPAIRYKTKN